MFASKNLTAGQLNALVKKLGGEERVHQILSDDVEVTFNEKHLLEPVATYRVNGAEQLDASEKFREDETGGVKIAYIGSDFRENFQGKVERGVESAELQIHDLRESARDPEIISELVGREVSESDELQDAAAQMESTLSHLWSLLRTQEGGSDDGPLLISGYANIFYIRDTDGTFWAVGVRWDSVVCGWNVNADPLDCLDDWNAGSRLVSGDS